MGLSLTKWFWLLGLGLGFSSPGQASRYQPDRQGFLFDERYLNQSFLSQTHQRSDPTPEVLNQIGILKLQQDYEDLNRDYSMRQSFGIVTRSQELSHAGQMEEFSKDIFHRIQSYQLDQERKRLEPLVEQIEKNEMLQILALPFGLAAALWYGKSFEVNLGGEMKASASTTLPSQTAEVKIRSPLLNGSLEVAAKAPASRDPASVALFDPIGRGDERLRVRLGRNLPSFGIPAGILGGISSEIIDLECSVGLAEWADSSPLFRRALILLLPFGSCDF